MSFATGRTPISCFLAQDLNGGMKKDLENTGFKKSHLQEKKPAFEELPALHATSNTAHPHLAKFWHST